MIDEEPSRYEQSPRGGLEFLEADTEVYNALVDAHTEYNSIIGRYNIQLINESYMDIDQNDVNTMYVVRMESTLRNKGFDYDQYSTKVQIVLRISKYDTERATAFIKTTIQALRQVLSREPLSSHALLEEITPEYTEPGRLTGCVLSLTCMEVDELERLDDNTLEAALIVRAGITEAMEYEKVFPPIKASKPLKKTKQEKKEYFAGG